MSFKDPSEATLGWLMLTPAVLLMCGVVVYPVCVLIYHSFFDLRLSGGSVPSFVGLQNYRDVLSDADFWEALRTTLTITLVTVPGALVLGLGMALLANLPFRRKWPIRLALLMPWALPLSFCGLISAWFFQSDYGLINDLLRRLGMHEPPLWLIQPNHALVAICLTILWKTSSFMALILLAGLQTIPDSLYEAAEVDGASRWQQFWHVTLPLLIPSMVVALIFRSLTALQTFDIPFTMTRGGPGSSTQTLAMLIHKTTIDYLDLGYGSAQAVLMFLLSMGVTAVYLQRVGSQV